MNTQHYTDKLVGEGGFSSTEHAVDYFPISISRYRGETTLTRDPPRGCQHALLARLARLRYRRVA
eukprot:scaffold3283_cov430-Prasinococcus_capsulatus_cf.AAC.4